MHQVFCLGNATCLLILGSFYQGIHHLDLQVHLVQETSLFLLVLDYHLQLMVLRTTHCHHLLQETHCLLAQERKPHLLLQAVPRTIHRLQNPAPNFDLCHDSREKVDSA